MKTLLKEIVNSFLLSFLIWLAASGQGFAPVSQSGNFIFVLVIIVIEKTFRLLIKISQLNDSEKSYKTTANRLQTQDAELANLKEELATAHKQIEDNKYFNIKCMLSRLLAHNPFAQTPLDNIFRNISQSSYQNDRLLKALSEPMQMLAPFNISARIETTSIYETSLSRCTCPDFVHNHQPCKHMYALAVSCGILIYYRFSDDTSISLQKLLKASSDNQVILKKIAESKNELQKIIATQQQTYPWIARVYADFLYTIDDTVRENLLQKKHSAPKAAAMVAQLNNEKRELQRNCKMLEYQLTYYETIFPWLEEFKEIPPISAWEDANEVRTTDSEWNTLQNWLSPVEFKQLTHTLKYQLALDRYKARSKNSWEAGIAYERYVGYLYEMKGYQVRFTGATEGLHDMGRDLVAIDNNEVLVIQCKRWYKEKTIHEKHIFQLYGSTVLFSLKSPKRKVRGVFITTAALSETAAECANFLKIDVIESQSFPDYPMVKCNISKDGEKIYHLPFDQRYDRIFITPTSGDTYVYTIAQAESLGFRRAYKWNPNK